MRILVTGGAGFIGSFIVKLLCDLHHKVIVYDNLSEGYAEAVDKQATLIIADLADRLALRKALIGCDVVIHMAASIEVGESVKNPYHFFENNVVNGMYVLEEMRAAKVKKIIFSSTAAVYSEKVSIPISEDAEKHPTNPYGASKLAYEDMLSSYHYCYGLDVTILRYFNVYGPWQRKHIETHVIPNFIKAMLEGKKVPLYWNGKCIRDFVYVQDIAEAHIAPLTQKSFNIYNIGTKSGTMIETVLDLIAKEMGVSYEIEDLGKREGDQMETVADVSKIEKELGWKSRISLEQGIKLTVDWYKKQHKESNNSIQKGSV